MAIKVDGNGKRGAAARVSSPLHCARTFRFKPTCKPRCRLTEAVMEAFGVSDIVKGRPAAREYENLKGIGQKMEIHRIEIASAQLPQ